jgi:hypothetical protein
VTISQIGDASDPIAFRAFYKLVIPALRAATRHQLRSVFHPDRSCYRPDRDQAGSICADCAAVVDDLALDSFVRLRRAVIGETNQTAKGTPVRELALVAAHLCSPDAATEQVETIAAQLVRLDLRDPDAGPAWLRAARAQLVYYPTRHLTAELRRDLAVARHGAAKPDRDLTSAAWAAPLRTSRAGLELLIAFIYRLRLGVADPYHTPSDIRDRHQLSVCAADDLLHMTLRRLREIRPEFFYANVYTPLAIASQISLDTAGPATDRRNDTAPEQQLLAKEAAVRARRLLDRLVSHRPGESHALRRRRRDYRQTLLAVAAAIDGDRSNLHAACAHRFALGELAAARLLRRLIRLVADADPGWVEHVLTAPSTRHTSPRPAD